MRELGFTIPTDKLASTKQEKLRAKQLAQSLQEQWQKNRESIQLAAKQLAQKNNGILRSSYECILTPFGTQGYFNTPNTIFINSELKHPDSAFLTMLHELAHLILNEQNKKLTSQEIETRIDSATKKYFKRIILS